jgi:hypothetical protein
LGSKAGFCVGGYDALSFSTRQLAQNEVSFRKTYTIIACSEFNLPLKQDMSVDGRVSVMAKV